MITLNQSSWKETSYSCDHVIAQNTGHHNHKIMTLAPEGPPSEKSNVVANVCL